MACLVSGVSCCERGVVTVAEERRHELSDGDCVIFSEVAGMPALNGGGARRVTVLGPYTFAVGDTRGLGAYAGGGWATPVRARALAAHAPLDAAALDGAVGGGGGGPAAADVVVPDASKAGGAAAAHAAWAALHAWAAAHGGAAPGAAALAAAAAARLGGAPAPGSAAAAAVRALGAGAAGCLPPLAAVAGAVAAQEAVKAVTGKFTPLKQWLYHDAAEALGGGDGDAWGPPLPPHAAPPAAGDRYAGQRAVLGDGVQAALGAQRVLLVGAGAIGCELLKNFALMGACAGAGGALTVVDGDRIEKSNLCRQLLFRPGDVGAAKAPTALAAAAALNAGLAGGDHAAHERFVGPATEALLGDAFWARTTAVANALDNMPARLYVDAQCVYYGRPLLESGTLGTKGNTQVIVPRLTENYGASRDPPEKEVAVCTLKNFPFRIEQ